MKSMNIKESFWYTLQELNKTIKLKPTPVLCQVQMLMNSKGVVYCTDCSYMFHQKVETKTHTANIFNCSCKGISMLR